MFVFESIYFLYFNVTLFQLASTSGATVFFLSDKEDNLFRSVAAFMAKSGSLRKIWLNGGNKHISTLNDARAIKPDEDLVHHKQMPSTPKSQYPVARR